MGQISFWMFLWRIFVKELTFQFVALMWVGLLHSHKDLNRWDWHVQDSSDIDKTWSGIKPKATKQTNKKSIDLPQIQGDSGNRCLQARTADFELASLHDCRSQFVEIHPTGSVSLEYSRETEPVGCISTNWLLQSWRLASSKSAVLAWRHLLPESPCIWGRSMDFLFVCFVAFGFIPLQVLSMSELSWTCQSHLFKSLCEWRRPTHIKATNWNVNSFTNILHRNIQNDIWPMSGHYDSAKLIHRINHSECWVIRRKVLRYY